MVDTASRGSCDEARHAGIIKQRVFRIGYDVQKESWSLHYVRAETLPSSPAADGIVRHDPRFSPRRETSSMLYRELLAFSFCSRCDGADRIDGGIVLVRFQARFTTNNLRRHVSSHEEETPVAGKSGFAVRDKIDRR